MKIKDAFDTEHTSYDAWRDRRTTRPTMTVGRARTILQAAKPKIRDRAAKINPTLTEAQAFDIFNACVTDEMDEAEKLDSLTARNIAREFARYA